MADERVRLLAQRDSLLARMRDAAVSMPGSAEPARRVHLTIAMDRLLARLLATSAWGLWVLKGGYANQLRAPSDARFTHDVDLRIDAPLGRAQAILAAAAGTDLADLLSYEIVGEPRPLDGPPGGGLRFLIQANLAGSSFVTFGADVNSGDAVVGELERHPSDPLVAKLRFPTSWFPVYPLAQQFAEKLHAFTRPRTQQNTRVKDLADMVWYLERYRFDSGTLLDACRATFERRSEHPWPPNLPTPPAEWVRPYASLRAEQHLAPLGPGAARDAVFAFLGPVLAEERGHQWDPERAAWAR